MKRTFLILAVTSILLLSCSQKQSGQPSPETPAAPSEKGNYTVFEPAEKSVEKVGDVIFEKDTITVWKEFTDKTDYVMQVTGPEGQDGIMNFRAADVRLVNKRTSDTLTLTRDSFKEFDLAKDHHRMIVQQVAVRTEINGAVVPLYVALCKPDTDVCDSYSITVKNGKLTIEVLDEGEMGD